MEFFMFAFDIFADSGCNIPDEFIEKYKISVVPYSCTVNGEERSCYKKGVPFDETAKKFYDDMRAGAEVKTSLIGAAKFIEYLTPSLEAGRDALLFTISSGISGTFAQASEAKKALEEKYPERKVSVIDTANASMGSGLQVIKAAEMREAGADLKECADFAEENAYKYNSLATVEDLKFLRKGGRVSAVAAIAGTLLNIKPVLWANDTVPAKLTVFAKERGKKKAFATILKTFKDTAENIGEMPVAIAHADCMDDANELAAMLKEAGVKDIITVMYDLCTGTHVGPGTIALFYWGKDRKKKAAEQRKLLLFKKKAESEA